MSLRSGAAVPSSSVHFTLSSQPSLTAFHSLQSCHSQFYSGSQLWFSSQLCQPPFLLNSNASHQGLPQPPSFLSMPSLPCSSHHVPPRVLRAVARSSPTCFYPPCPLFKLLFSGPFSCFLYFSCNLSLFLYFATYLFCGLLLLTFWRFNLTAETFVAEIVLVPLFIAVPTSDYYNAFLNSVSF